MICSALPSLPMLQVGVKISHHTMTADDPNPKPEKALVFVLDEVKDEPEGQGKDGKSKKRKRKAEKNAGFQPTVKNFGSRVSINKIKSASKFVIGWRCRLGSSTKPLVFSHVFQPSSN